MFPPHPQLLPRPVRDTVGVIVGTGCGEDLALGGHPQTVRGVCTGTSCEWRMDRSDVPSGHRLLVLSRALGCDSAVLARLLRTRRRGRLCCSGSKTRQSPSAGRRGKGWECRCSWVLVGRAGGVSGWAPGRLPSSAPWPGRPALTTTPGGLRTSGAAPVGPSPSLQSRKKEQVLV